MIIFENKPYTFSKKNKKSHLIVFDRDDTLIEDPYKQMSGLKLTWKFGAINFLRDIQTILNCEFSIASNQSRIFDNTINKEILSNMTYKIFNSATKNRINFSYIVYCPHDRKQLTPCECRKPKVGMLLFLQKKHDVTREKMVFIGDSINDENTASNFDIKFYRYNNNFSELKHDLISYFDIKG